MLAIPQQLNQQKNNTVNTMWQEEDAFGSNEDGISDLPSLKKQQQHHKQNPHYGDSFRAAGWDDSFANSPGPIIPSSFVAKALHVVNKPPLAQPEDGAVLEEAVSRKPRSQRRNSNGSNHTESTSTDSTSSGHGAASPIQSAKSSKPTKVVAAWKLRELAQDSPSRKGDDNSLGGKLQRLPGGSKSTDSRSVGNESMGSKRSKSSAPAPRSTTKLMVVGGSTPPVSASASTNIHDHNRPFPRLLSSSKARDFSDSGDESSSRRGSRSVSVGRNDSGDESSSRRGDRSVLSSSSRRGSIRHMNDSGDESSSRRGERSISRRGSFSSGLADSGDESSRRGERSISRRGSFSRGLGDSGDESSRRGERSFSKRRGTRGNRSDIGDESSRHGERSSSAGRATPQRRKSSDSIESSRRGERSRSSGRPARKHSDSGDESSRRGERSMSKRRSTRKEHKEDSLSSSRHGRRGRDELSSSRHGDPSTKSSRSRSSSAVRRRRKDDELGSSKHGRSSSRGRKPQTGEEGGSSSRARSSSRGRREEPSKSHRKGRKKRVDDLGSPEPTERKRATGTPLRRRGDDGKDDDLGSPQPTERKGASGTPLRRRGEDGKDNSKAERRMSAGSASGAKVIDAFGFPQEEPAFIVSEPAFVSDSSERGGGPSDTDLDDSIRPNTNKRRSRKDRESSSSSRARSGRKKETEPVLQTPKIRDRSASPAARRKTVATPTPMGRERSASPASRRGSRTTMVISTKRAASPITKRPIATTIPRLPSISRSTNGDDNEQADAPAFQQLRASNHNPRSKHYAVRNAERSKNATQSTANRSSVLDSLNQFGVDGTTEDLTTMIPKVEASSDGKKRLVIELGEVPPGLF